MKYLEKLVASLKDNDNVAVEMFLAWIAIMLTSLVILGVLSYAGS
jgi:hypothetical protein